jgi:hypothetical protein
MFLSLPPAPWRHTASLACCWLVLPSPYASRASCTKTTSPSQSSHQSTVHQQSASSLMSRNCSCGLSVSASTVRLGQDQLHDVRLRFGCRTIGIDGILLWYGEGRQYFFHAVKGRTWVGQRDYQTNLVYKQFCSSDDPTTTFIPISSPGLMYAFNPGNLTLCDGCQGKTSYAELWSGKYVLGDETRRETIVYIR